MERKPLDKMKVVSKYDPSKSYEWHPEDIFTVNGAEIDAWNKALTLMVATPEFQRFVHIQRAAVLMGDFIKQGVEQDLIKAVETKENKIELEDGSIEQLAETV